MHTLAISTLTALLMVTYFSANPTEASPVKFMCDMCESNFMQCLMKCHMEEYMTRHNYRNHVYMGESTFKPKKNRLDKIMDNIMHSTGHDHVK